MKHFARRAVCAGLIAAGAALLTLPMSASAQFQSPPYLFLKAVRDADGDKATELLNQPGTTVVDSKEYNTGKGALHIVVERRDLTWLGFLIGKGASINIKDKQGTTPLLAAVQIGFAEGAQLLIQRKARVDEPNNSGETPLIRAVQRRDIRLVRLLLGAGANADKRDTLAGLSARDYAKRDPRAAAVLKVIEETEKKPAEKIMGPS